MLTTLARHFRQAEKIISASTLFLTVVGYHLMEIHTMTSVISISLHNAFDAENKGEVHPLRAVLHLHYFTSTFVQEITTAHLLAQKAIFAQIFALTHDELSRYLDDNYLRYQYCEDIDHAKRACKC